MNVLLSPSDTPLPIPNLAKADDTLILQSQLVGWDLQEAKICFQGTLGLASFTEPFALQRMPMLGSCRCSSVGRAFA